MLTCLGMMFQCLGGGGGDVSMFGEGGDVSNFLF